MITMQSSARREIYARRRISREAVRKSTLSGTNTCNMPETLLQLSVAAAVDVWH